ncbi:putative S-locus glycoprotein [Helianthus annuus]|nr:putative S-locus glycoprotein [Helianthus annuus]
MDKILLFGLLFSILATCTIMTVDQVIRDGDTLVSAGEIYELGFFSPGKSTKRFLGIWYKNISPQTVVWVANRETPITDSSGVFRVATNGSLLVIVGSNNIVVWSSNTSLVSPTTTNPVAQLLDSGNLVVGRYGEESSVWQSFDYPGDTFLPGMKFGKDLVTGLDRRWRPWKSLDDPSPGEFVGFMDTNGFPQLIKDNGSVPLTRYGPWNGNTFNGLPYHKLNSPIKHKFVFDDKDVYYAYTVVNNSFIARIHVNPDGNFFRWIWVARTQQWSRSWQEITDICDKFGLCGPNGRCNPQNSPACSCMEGFEPRKPDEWSASEWSRGCRRRTPLDCPNGDGFQVFKNIKLPDTRRSWYNMNMTLDECASACKSNCSCMAYANIYTTNGGSGCLLWFDDLVDVRTVEESQDLYVRMAQSDITSKRIFIWILWF